MKKPPRPDPPERLSIEPTEKPKLPACSLAKNAGGKLLTQ